MNERVTAWTRLHRMIGRALRRPAEIMALSAARVKGRAAAGEGHLIVAM